MTSSKDHQKYRYNLEESYCDFLIYYNDREHSTIKLAPFRAMMNIENKDLINKIRENIIKRSQKAKMLKETFLKNSIVRVSNRIRFIDEKHIRFNPSRGYKKFISKEVWIVESRLNYCLVKILENPSNYCGLEIGAEWNIEKAAIKRSKKEFK